MEFLNAKKGAKIILIAVILQIIAEALQDIALAIGTGAYIWQTEWMLNFSYMGMAFEAAAFVATIWGLICAKKDEIYFKHALIFAIVAIPLEVVGTCLRLDGTIIIGSVIATTLTDWTECIIVMLICMGFAKIYQKKEEEAKRKGWISAGLLFTIMYVVAKAFEVVIMSDQASIWGWPTIITLTVIDVLLSSAAFTKMIICLVKAKKEL